MGRNRSADTEAAAEAPTSRGSGTRRVVTEGEQGAELAPAPLDGSAVSGWDEEPDTSRFLGGGGLMKAGAERRAARRVALEVPVAIELGDALILGTTEDISTSGLFVASSHLVPSGRTVKLRFDMPHGVVETSGVVVRFRTPARGTPPGIGLVFSALTNDQSECISAYCDASPDSIVT